MLFECVAHVALWLAVALGLRRKNVKMLFLGLDNAGKTTLLCAMSHGARQPEPTPTHYPSKPALGPSGPRSARPARQARPARARPVRPARTKCADYEEFTIGKARIRAVDLGGHESARALWCDYLASTGCVAFVVDATDAARFGDAKAQLDVRPAHTQATAFLRCSVRAQAASPRDRRCSKRRSSGACRSSCLVTSTTSTQPSPMRGSATRSASRSVRRSCATGPRAHGPTGPLASSTSGFGFSGRTRPIDVFMCSATKRYGYAEGLAWVSKFL